SPGAVPLAGVASGEPSSVPAPSDLVLAGGVPADNDCVVPAPVGSEPSAVSVPLSASEPAKIETKIAGIEKPMTAQAEDQVVVVLASETLAAGPSPVVATPATDVAPPPVADVVPGAPGSPTPVADAPGSPVTTTSTAMPAAEKTQDYLLLKHQQRRD